MSERNNSSNTFRGRGRGSNRGGGGGRGGSNSHHQQQQQGGGGGGSSTTTTTTEKPKKENILDLTKYMDKSISVKFTGGREG